MLKLSSPLMFCICRLIPQIIMYSVLSGYLSPPRFTTSPTNFVSQMFSDSAHISWTSTVKSWRLSNLLYSNPKDSFFAILFPRCFCYSSNIFTAHFVLYHVFFGTVSSSHELSSSTDLGSRRRPWVAAISRSYSRLTFDKVQWPSRAGNIHQ